MKEISILATVYTTMVHDTCLLSMLMTKLLRIKNYAQFTT